MKKAYCIITHKNTQILRELVHSSKDNIYLYIDGKVDLNIFDEYMNLKNVEFVENRKEIKWGHISQVEATIQLLKEASKEHFDYLFLLSGDCLPIKSNEMIDEFLIKNYGKEFIARDINMLQEKIDERVRYNYLELAYIKNKKLTVKLILKLHQIFNKLGFFRNKEFKNLPKLYKGTNWFGITKELTGYILEYLSKNPKYLNSFKSSICADEIFFHTIVYNSKFKGNIYEPKDKSNICFGALRYIDWKTGPDYPRTLDESDFVKMKNTECIFARKFNEKLDLEKYRKVLLDL